MEKEINIAEILKNKPEGTKLWTDMFGEVTLYVVTDKCDAFQVKHHNKEPWFDKDGKLCKEGVLCIYPSESMRDWSKFTWKKGDVLVSKDNVHIIFEKFEDDAYTRFKGKHYLWKDCDEEDYNKEETKMLTSVFEKANDDVAQTYIKTIEEKLGGKLNGETLEVEKPQPEFKDGDIVVYGKSVAICRKIYKHTLYFYVSIDETFGLLFDDNCVSAEGYRFATEEEKQQLFSALAKEGKAWDKKKEVVDLKPKVDLKPFDKVLSRRCSEDYWVLNFYSHKSHKTDYHICIDGSSNLYCIPYNEETAHLLGTTDEWKGGEG